MTFAIKPSVAGPLAFACALLCGQTHAQAADTDFTFQFKATDTETGQAVKGSVFLAPWDYSQTPLVDETLADGTRHRSFTLDNDTGGSPFYPASWKLDSGGTSVSGVHNYSTPWPSFTVDEYLYTNGSSSLKYYGRDYDDSFRGYVYESILTFQLDCTCNNLFTSQINAGTFAQYDTISGKGSYAEYAFDLDQFTYVQAAENHVTFSGTAAVPEPGTIAFALAGLGAMGLRRRLAGGHRAA